MALSANTRRTILSNRQTILYGQTPTTICREQLCAMAEAAGMSVADLARQVVSGSSQDNLCLLREYHTNTPHLAPLFDDLATLVISDSQDTRRVVSASSVPGIDKQQDGAAVSMKIVDKDDKSGSKNLEIKKHSVRRNKHRKAILQRAFEKSTEKRSLLTEIRGSREDTLVPGVTESNHERTKDNDPRESSQNHASPFQVSWLLNSNHQSNPSTSLVLPLRPPAHHQATIDSKGSVREPTSHGSEKVKGIANSYDSPIINNSPYFHKKQNRVLSCSSHLTSQTSDSTLNRTQSLSSSFSHPIFPLPLSRETKQETEKRINKSKRNISVKEGGTENHAFIPSASYLSKSNNTSDQDDNNFLAGLLFDDKVMAKERESPVKCLDREDKAVSTKGSNSKTNDNYNQVLETLLFGESLAVSECGAGLAVSECGAGHTQDSHVLPTTQSQHCSSSYENSTLLTLF